MEERLITLRASMLPSVTGGHWREFDQDGFGQILLGPGDWLPWLSWPFAVDVWVEEGDLAVVTTSADGVSAQANHLPFEQGVRIAEETDLTLESLGRWSLIGLKAQIHDGGEETRDTIENGSRPSAAPVRFDSALLRDEDWFPGPHHGN
ncbi:MAG: hypothetical protein CME01_03125 [Geminicoccus sp.]|nr:hypothetical protein [Geminicoccus sp.]